MSTETAIAILVAYGALVCAPYIWIFIKDPINFQEQTDTMTVRTKTTSAVTPFRVFCEFERNYRGSPTVLIGRNVEIIELAYTKRFFFNGLMTASIVLGGICLIAIIVRFTQFTVNPTFNELFVDKIASGGERVPDSVMVCVGSLIIYYITLLLSFTQKNRLLTLARRLTA